MTIHPTASDDDVDMVLPRISTAQILLNQEQERKELRKRIERIRSSIPKKDRAGRIRAAEEAVQEERTLLQTQADERLEAGIDADAHTPSLQGATLPEAQTDAGPIPDSAKPESKAARRRRKKAQQELEAQKRIDEEKAAMGPSPKFLETQAIDSQLKPKNLRIHPIAADGHCLYSAVAHQMDINKFPSQVSASVEGLRNATADYLMANTMEYMPFVESANSDNELFARYCEELRNEAVWGGQVELKAMADLLGAVIEVYAADLPLVKMGEGNGGEPLRVSFHRHYLGLGEHYNSIISFT